MMNDNIVPKNEVANSNVGTKEEVKYISFDTLYSEIQRHISSQYFALMADATDEKQRYALKEQIRNIIDKYIRDKKVEIKGYSNNTSVSQKIYNEMVELSILTPLLDTARNDIEEININRWDDIKVHYDTGEVIATDETFRSAEHCSDVIKRLLKKESDMIIDKSRPIVRGHLHNRIRLTIMGDGVIDKDIGMAASLRIINPKRFTAEDFISKGTITKEMLDALSIFSRYGVSMCITGETGSGKTTLLMYLASQIPVNKRVYCIEEDVREFDLTKRDEKGRVINSVVHTHTQKSDDPGRNIDQDKLLETALTMNPDVIVVSEMKGKEANAAQEAARTGHAVLTTTHAKSCRATYWRMVTLCKMGVDIDENTLERLCIEAFPIVVYIRKDEDNIRRVKEITESYIDENGNRSIRTLYRFVVTENREENGRLKIDGYYKKENGISEYLKNELISKNITKDLLDIL